MWAFFGALPRMENNPMGTVPLEKPNRNPRYRSDSDESDYERAEISSNVRNAFVRMHFADSTAAVIPKAERRREPMRVGNPNRFRAQHATRRQHRHVGGADCRRPRPISTSCSASPTTLRAPASDWNARHVDIAEFGQGEVQDRVYHLRMRSLTSVAPR